MEVLAPVTVVTQPGTYRLTVEDVMRRVGDGFVVVSPAGRVTMAGEASSASVAADRPPTAGEAAAWLSALEVSSLVTQLPAFHSNFGKTLRKRHKLHFLDTGLVCSLLGIRDAATLERHPLRGAIFESFVAAEVLKTLENRREKPRLFHWRDTQGHEVDLIVDLGDRRIAVEVKSGETVASDWAAPLRRWLDLPGNDGAKGVVVHGGTAGYDARGIAVRPWWGV